MRELKQDRKFNLKLKPLSEDEVIRHNFRKLAQREYYKARSAGADHAEALAHAVDCILEQSLDGMLEDQ